MNFDACIHGGTVHSPEGAIEADVLVSNERIAGIVSRGYPISATRTIDARGMHVLPGLVDLHAHTRSPGYEYKEDFLTCSQAAAVGGITSFVDMPNVEPPTDSVELFEQKRSLAAGLCIVDWGHQVSPRQLSEIPRFAQAGVTGFKIFQVSGGYPHDPRLAISDPAEIFAAFTAIRKTGLHCSVHPFSQSLMDELSRVELESGSPRNIRTFASLYVRDVVWRSAVAVLLELQAESGVRLNLLHTHAEGSLRLIRRAKERGQRITAAIDPKYFHLTGEDFDVQGGRAAPGGFIVEDAERMSAIWDSLNDGTLDMIDSDHAPHSLEDLDAFAKDPWTGPWGSPQYDYLLSLVLTDVAEGKLPLSSVVRLTSSNAAKLIGIYPRKGALQVGSDADLVIVDLNAEVVPSDSETHTKCHWTPYVGRRLRGKPVLTMRRGEVIAEDGKAVADPGSGRYIAGVPQD